MNHPLAPRGRRGPLRLRAAVERLLSERAAARTSEFPRCLAAADAGRNGPAVLRRRRNPRLLTITLRDPARSGGALPTDELLDAALAVITQGHHRPGDWRLEGWFFRVSLRAVCEAILEAGHLPAPLAVHLERHPHQDVWPAMPRVRLPAPLKGFYERRQPGEPLRFLVRLEEPCAPGGPTISELLDAALNVLASGHHPPGRWRQERWFFRVALRAVCEAVLTSDSGRLPLPLRVRFRRQHTAELPAWHARVRTIALATFAPACP